MARLDFRTLGANLLDNFERAQMIASQFFGTLDGVTFEQIDADPMVMNDQQVSHFEVRWVAERNVPGIGG